MRSSSGTPALARALVEAVPEGMKSASSKLAPAPALHDLQVESRPAHDALEALRKPVSSPLALLGHAGHDELCGFILTSQGHQVGLQLLM